MRCTRMCCGQLKTQSGSGYVYALIEHQSTPDKHMTFRLMRYAFAIMSRHLDAGNEHLPLVIPMLFLSWADYTLSLFDVLAG